VGVGAYIAAEAMSKSISPSGVPVFQVQREFSRKSPIERRQN